MSKTKQNKKADKSSNVSQAIKRTLLYRSIFSYPLSFFQLATYLVTDKPIKENKIREALNLLIKQGWLKKRYGKYEIKNLKYVNWDKKYKDTRNFIKANESGLKLIGSIPWVKFVGITGSAAAYCLNDKQQDLDIFIITDRERVWLTRGFITLINKITGKHPKFDGQPGSFCTNIFIDEATLAWDRNNRNVFVATDIVLMQPVVDKNQTYLKFLNSNRWTKEYFANFKFALRKKDKVKMQSLFLDLLERAAMILQKRYMRKKQTTEITTKHLIHFNKNDNSQKILKEYYKLLRLNNL